MNPTLTERSARETRPSVRARPAALPHAREWSIAGALLLLVAVTTIINPGFVSPQGLTDLFLNASILALLAVGQAVVVITRNIDLSVGSVVGLVAFTVGQAASDDGLDVTVALAMGVAMGAAFGLLSGALAGCGGGTTKDSAGQAEAGRPTPQADPNAELKKGLKLAFLPKQINNPFFTLVSEEGIKAAGEFGSEAKEVGPSDASASSQVSYINTLIQQRHDAIMISANDPNAVCGSLKQAMAQDIKVVSFDSDTDQDCRHVFVNQARAEEVGRIQVELIAGQIDHKGQIAILSATANATNQNTWIEHMKKELEKPEYKNMELVKVAYGDDDDQKSFQQTQGLLQAYPDLKGIISPTTVGIAAAARYISESDYKDEVALTGLGTPNQMRKYVKDGTVEKFALWNPKDLGYLATYTAGALASGQITGAKGEKFTAGRLGERTIEEGGEVVLGPPFTFDSGNIDDFDF